MKTFSFGGKPFETRLFMRHSDGVWAGYSYEWNAAGTDADLLPAGKTKVLSNGITWRYPSREQCLQCHTPAAGFTLGPEVVQLNGRNRYPSTGRTANQLATLEHIGMFESGLPASPPELQALASLEDTHQALSRRARSYLHANCSGCHRPNGPTQASIDLRFQTAINEMGICGITPGLGDLGVTGSKLLSPGDPNTSIISLRMHALNINRMPPLGTAIEDLLGTGVVDEWIRSSDVCDVILDTDSDGTADNADSCTLIANPDQYDSDGDGYGSRCDPDFNDNGLVEAFDFSLMKSMFGSFTAPHQDLNGNGVVDAFDFSQMKAFFGKPPGPSGLVP
jgi:mono/diheme cytochrome c family protein